MNVTQSVDHTRRLHRCRPKKSGIDLPLIHSFKQFVAVQIPGRVTSGTEKESERKKPALRAGFGVPMTWQNVVAGSRIELPTLGL